MNERLQRLIDEIQASETVDWSAIGERLHDEKQVDSAVRDYNSCVVAREIARRTRPVVRRSATRLLKCSPPAPRRARLTTPA